ncbi:MFS transporter [Natronoglycomyces albus]|uniref:MFS transporter n=1 Tax=Natronoglycomyces albus TaxID=2811108 RepID=A0A895XSD9_9ACTN|nr:MFS transporter [Natronoglycomyces albus]QSB05466.1 MFS transporter [Natronoglycomyces albus]
MSPILSHHFKDTFRALQVRNYRVYISGQVVATIGFWLQMTATSWLVLELTGDSGTALGTAMALQFGPFLVLSLLGGRLADRFDKRKVLLLGGVCNVLMTSVLAITVLNGNAELWHVYLFMLCFGTTSALEGPSRQAFAAELVDSETLPNALALNSATFNIGRITGPAVAGLLIALTNTGVVLALNAAAWLVPIAVMVTLLGRPLHVAPRSREERKENAGIVDALRYLRTRPDLTLVLVVMLFVGGFAFNFPVTLSLLAKTEFHSGADTFGLLITSLSVGALAGALASGKRHTRPGIYTVLGACLALGIGTTAVGFAPTFIIAMMLLVPTGFAMVFAGQSANQRVQMGVADRYRGRIMALYMLVFIGSTPLCAPIVGWISEMYGARAGLWLGGIVTLLTAFAAYIAKARRKSTLARRATPMTEASGIAQAQHQPVAINPPEDVTAQPGSQEDVAEELSKVDNRTRAQGWDAAEPNEFDERDQFQPQRSDSEKRSHTAPV